MEKFDWIWPDISGDKDRPFTTEEYIAVNEIAYSDFDVGLACACLLKVVGIDVEALFDSGKFEHYLGSVYECLRQDVEDGNYAKFQKKLVEED